MANKENSNRFTTRKKKVQNEKVLNLDHLGIKRFFNMDSNTYRDGALDSKTKELLGLVASTVLGCNDCIDYHLEQCAKQAQIKQK